MIINKRFFSKDKLYTVVAENGEDYKVWGRNEEEAKKGINHYNDNIKIKYIL